MSPFPLRRAAGVASVLLGAVVAALPAAAQWPPWQARKPKPPVYDEILVSASWVARRVKDPGVVIVDAREDADYAAGHIPAARHMAVWTWGSRVEGLRRALAKAGVPGSGIVVCYSDNRDPLAAGQIFWLLELAGHRNVRVLNGGLDAWKAAALETTTRPPAAPRAIFKEQRDTSRIADHDYVRQRFGRRGFTIMDWRSPAEWDAGHIPHSLPFPLEDLRNEDGTVMDGPTMRPLFEQFGPREREYVDLEDEFIVCGVSRGDSAAVHPYLAARLAGIARVRVYPEGFPGWKAHAASPVVRIVSAREVKAMLHAAGGPRLGDDPLPGLAVFDLRGEREYLMGHLPGAVWLPSDSCDARLEQRMARFWPGADRAHTPLLFYCYGPGCTRSRNCSTIAARHGYADLLWFKDGTAGWTGVGEELVTSAK